jgi:hypothetical protein
MHFILKYISLLITILFFTMSAINAQEVRATDNKGTITTLLKPTIAEIYDVVGGFEITDANVIIEFDTANTTTEITNTDYYAYSNTAITIKELGTYKVTYRVTAEITSGNSRSGTEYRLLKNSNIVDGSYSAAYHRNNSAGKNTATASRILVLTPNDFIQVQGNRYNGTSTIKTAVQGSSLLIERIK